MNVLFKLTVFFTSWSLLLVSSVQSASAQEEFTTNFDTTYTILPSGDAQVLQDITLTNNFSTIYATSYSLSIEGKKPQAATAQQGKTSLPVQVNEQDKKTSITISFPEAVVGKGKQRNFQVRYEVPSLALQNGQVWELNVPRIASSENFNSYNITVRIPKAFGTLAYISPDPRQRSETDTERVFTFEKEEIVKAGVVAAFGNFQIFEFNLTYHLQNPYSDKNGKTDIALVPDTAFQRVYYSNIDPKPEKIYLDEDGNWLGTYLLKPNQQLDIQTKGAVQLFSKPQTHYPKIIPSNAHISESTYWQTQDLQISQKAQSLNTPKNIYNFVVDTLSYDYNRVSDNAERLGAVQALQNPQNAICMEFTDLFVALARSSGIPSREINGFAYTENPEIQPLSLVADILHAWPEYWDDKARVWRPVDPTWGNTTGGVDFFNKFDLSHITFAIHGIKPDSPAAAGSYKLAISPERDVSITFGRLPDEREPQTEDLITSGKSWLPLVKNKLKIKIVNKGHVAIYDQDIQIRPLGIKLDSAKNERLNFLAPFSTHEFNLSYSLPFSVKNLFTPKDKSSKIQILIGDNTTSYQISQERIQLSQAAIIFSILLLLVGAGFGIRYGIKHVARNVIARSAECSRSTTRQSQDEQPTSENSTET